jgi:hypothetical protein
MRTASVWVPASLIAVWSLAAGVARADDTFESKATGAQRIKRLEDLVWPLTATCEFGTDTQQRQCRKVRDTRAAELASATLIIDADNDAFSVGAWNPATKSAPIALSACIRCSGLELDGKTWVIAGTGATPPTFEGGRVTAKLHDNGKQFLDAKTAQAFAAMVKNARIQLLVKVPAKSKLVVDGKNVLALDVIGYRVYMPCDGSIVVANPSSGPAEGDKKQCVQAP